MWTGAFGFWLISLPVCHLQSGFVLVFEGFGSFPSQGSVELVFRFGYS